MEKKEHLMTADEYVVQELLEAKDNLNRVVGLNVDLKRKLNFEKDRNEYLCKLLDEAFGKARLERENNATLIYIGDQYIGMLFDDDARDEEVVNPFVALLELIEFVSTKVERE